MKIAFLGLGTMGLPMAANLLQAGYDVCVWNRSPQAAAALADYTPRVALTPQAAVQEAEVVISMLADDAATRAVFLDSQLLNQLSHGTIHIGMSTLSVALTEELTRLHAECGLYYLAAPVLGRVNVAEAGQLNILAAGQPEVLATVQPLLDVLGQKTWYCGEQPEQASAVKLSVNLMIASAIGAMSEGTALAQGYGVDRQDFLQLITSTVFAAPVYQGYGKAIAGQHFTPAGFKLALGPKDVKLALEAGESRSVPLPLASTLRDAHIESLAHGEGQQDWSALSRSFMRRAGQL